MGGGKGGPSGNTTSTQSAAPWGPQQPYLSSIFSNAQNLYQNNTPQYYPGQTVSPLTGDQLGALSGIENTVSNDPLRYIPSNTVASIAQGQPLSNPALGTLGGLAHNNYGAMANSYEQPFAHRNAANSAPGQGALMSYISGDRLKVGNPYLGSVSDSVLAEVMPRIQSQFVNSGMLGSPEAARASSAGATSALAPFAFGQYQQEEQNQINSANSLANRFMQGAGLQQQAAGDIANRYLSGAGLQLQSATNYGNQMSSAYGDMLKAAALAPSVQATQYAPLDALFSAGGARQADTQNNINDAVARWNFGQSLPFNQLNQYIGEVTGNYGGTTTMTQPYFSQQGQNMMGGALGGATLGSSILGGTALGAGGGAGLGAAIGALLL